MKRLVALLTAGSSLLFAVSPSMADGSRAISCYQPVHQPAEYASVAETVMVRPAETVYETVPPVYGTEKRHVLVEPEPERVAGDHRRV
ncbi:MAG: hypothetical protein OSA96_17585, partial [Aurantimonas coralicida]|nr:hypothetical protein [Aurantimonas coralicida]